MSKILSNKELNEKIIKGVNTLADVVGSTLGPKGRTVIIKQKDRKPIITKDGVTCARSVVLEDPFENLGVEVVKQATESTVMHAGDGTTSSTVLARVIINNALKVLSNKSISLMELSEGIDYATKFVLKSLKKNSKPITKLEEIEQIATISANGDKGIGKLIATAVDKIGRDGSITIQESRSNETSLEVIDGFSFDSGLLANAFITDERRGIMRFEDCIVLVTDKSISTIDELLPILEIAARDGRPFVIVAEMVEGQALAALIANQLRGNMKVCAVKAPRYGEERRNILEDLSVIVGSKFISRESGINLKNVKLPDLGKAKIVESNKMSSTIVSDACNTIEIEKRKELLKEQIRNCSNLNEAQKIQDRINRLASGIAVIKVGGNTEIEMVEKKHRIEDALEAVSSAQLEGIVCGGGVALLNASFDIIDNDIMPNINLLQGINVMVDSISEPFKIILENSYIDKENIDKAIEDLYLKFHNNNLSLSSSWIGFDVTENNCLNNPINMLEKGIIDPLKVVRVALENAVSVATTLLSSNAAIIE